MTDAIAAATDDIIDVFLWSAGLAQQVTKAACDCESVDDAEVLCFGPIPGTTKEQNNVSLSTRRKESPLLLPTKPKTSTTVPTETTEATSIPFNVIFCDRVSTSCYPRQRQILLQQQQQQQYNQQQRQQYNQHKQQRRKLYAWKKTAKHQHQHHPQLYEDEEYTSDSSNGAIYSPSRKGKKPMSRYNKTLSSPIATKRAAPVVTPETPCTSTDQSAVHTTRARGRSRTVRPVNGTQTDSYLSTWCGTCEDPDNVVLDTTTIQQEEEEEDDIVCYEEFNFPSKECTGRRVDKETTVQSKRNVAESHYYDADDDVTNTIRKHSVPVFAAPVMGSNYEPQVLYTPKFR